MQFYRINRDFLVIKHISSLQELLADMEVEKHKRISSGPAEKIGEKELDELLGLNEAEHTAEAEKSHF